MKYIMVRLPEDIHKKLRRIAIDDDSNLQQIIAGLIHEFIRKRSNVKLDRKKEMEMSS